MVASIKPWTRAELARLPDDGNRYEVLDGRLLVTPQASVAHQEVAKQLIVTLELYRRSVRSFSVFGPGALPFGDSELQPDILVVPGVHTSGEWKELPRAILVVEVLSRSTRHRDFGIKLDAYLKRLAIPEVWLADRERRVVHVCRRGVEPRAEASEVVWTAPGAGEPARIDVESLFPLRTG